MTTITTTPYLAQKTTWPSEGRHIMAHYDEETVIVYQAYRPEIGLHAAKHQSFGGPFSYNRMSWIKPNFLWMMFRSGWGTKEGQEVTLAITLRRKFFDELLESAVPSGFTASNFDDIKDWKNALHNSNVRLQWDPDHDPSGTPVTRRAIQLGLRGETLRRFGTDEALHIEDISDFVSEQRSNLHNPAKFVTPSECPYLPSTERARIQISLDPPPAP